MAHAQHHQHNGKGGHALPHIDTATLRSIDDLAGLSADQLAALYAAGQTPKLGVLAGHTRGRLLAIPVIHSIPRVGTLLGGRGEKLLDAAERVLDRLAATRFMPWRGKTFAPPSEHQHTAGTNDVLGRAVLPFDAHVERSALDREPALVIHYDRKENPRLLRGIVGELREVSRGVWLGPVHVRGPNGPRILVWYAVAKD